MSITPNVYMNIWQSRYCFCLFNSSNKSVSVFIFCPNVNRRFPIRCCISREGREKGILHSPSKDKHCLTLPSNLFCISQ